MTPTAYLQDLAGRTATSFWQVAKIMVPAMIFVQVADAYGLSAVLGDLLAPVMGLVGLPGEAGLVWAIALLTGFYGGVGALVALVAQVELTALQLNVLLSMILFAHAIPVEQSIVKASGSSFTLTSVIRLVVAFLFGFLLHHIGSFFGALDEPAALGLLPQTESGGGVVAAARSIAETLIFMALMLLFLLAVLDGLKRIGIFDRMTALFTPFFERIGIAHTLAPLVVIGMLLGLTYGGGLIVEESRKRSFTKRELLTPLAGLSIIHALIEDTLVVLALGADLWIVLLWRTLFALAAIAAIAALVRYWPQKAIAEPPHSL
jgi:hypothetical protein